MSRSTFSGPVQVGIDDAPFSENTVAKIGPNRGFAKMVQSAPITQSGTIRYPTSATDMTMVIPALSTITRISVLVTTAWDQVLDIGQAWGELGDRDTNDLVNDLVLTTLGVVVVGPGDTDNLATDDINNWMNNSSTNSPYGGDRCITAFTASGGSAGVGVLTVEYSQAVDLEAIA